ncbi:hypothetical protein [Enterococcus sp. LJL90]
MENKSYSSEFSIVRITKTDTKEYADALRIYNKETPSEIKTDSNEITSMLSKKDILDFEIYGFILNYNGKVSGLALLTYLKDSKSILIEYIAIDSQIRTNIAFLVYLNLLRSYIVDIALDVSYWLVEISNKDNGENIDKESRLFRKLIYLDNFGKLEGKYKTLPIGQDNYESSFEASLYINAGDNVSSISKETYLQIVQSIYYYSVRWFEYFDILDKTTNFQEIVEKNINEIKKTIKLKPKIIIEYSIYDIQSNGDLTENTSKLLPSSKDKVPKKKLIVSGILGFLGAIVLLVLVNTVLKKFGIEIGDVNTILGALITVILTPILSVYFTNIKNKS